MSAIKGIWIENDVKLMNLVSKIIVDNNCNILQLNQAKQ